jgi:hypothetical protein
VRELGAPDGAREKGLHRKMPEFQYQCLEVSVYLGAGLLIVYFGFRFYGYLFGG